MLKSAIFAFYFITGTALSQVPIIEPPKPAQFSIPEIGLHPRQPSVNNPSVLHLNMLNPGADQRNQHRYIMNEVDNFNKQNFYRDQLIADATAELEKNEIHYEFEISRRKGVKPFYSAYSELKKMIEGESQLDLKLAVYLVEHAYDTTLEYEDFNRQINEAVFFIGEKMRLDKMNPTDNTAKVMSIFQYMSDTITIYSSVLEKKITSYPKTYDFEDFWGRQDYRKMFVSKTLTSGSGQCHSLPLLFLVLSQEIGAEANLSFSPNHSFVKFKDKRGNWHNLELTSGMLASDHFMIQSGYVKAEALQSKIFLEPISKHQTIVQCLNDLALGYMKKYGYDEFVKSSTNLALSHYPNSLSAHQINANYFAALSEYIIYQYRQKGWGKEILEQDQKAMSVINSAVGATKHIEQLGYSDMPADAYEAWLKSIQAEAWKQQHNKAVQGLNGMIERK
jgi:hypothetical protein